jgi:FecR protein
MASLRSSRGRLVLAAAVIVTVGVVATVLLFIVGPATAKQFATLHPIEGVVDVQRGGEGPFRTGSEGATLQRGDVVRTGPDGLAEIEYFDGSMTRLDEGTTFVLRELATIPDVPGSKLIEGEQAAGRTFQRVVELTDSQSRFDVETPTATASVRGTQYVLTVHLDGSTELWVLPDDDPATASVVLVLDDGTEIEVTEGEGILILPPDRVEGPFQLTEEQVNDAWVSFNQCQLDDLDLEKCQPEPEPEPQPEPPDQDGDPPPPPPLAGDGEPEVAEVAADTGDEPSGGDGGGGDGPPPPGPPPPPPPPPNDQRPLRFELSWSSGPSDLDLHVQTPLGEVWGGNDCLAYPGVDGCWASSEGDAAPPIGERAVAAGNGGGSETVTIRPVGDPDPGDFVPGGYHVWVENFSCDDSFAGSGATVSISRGGPEIGSASVPEADGETWTVGTVGMSQNGHDAVALSGDVFGEECQAPLRVGLRGNLADLLERAADETGNGWPVDDGEPRPEEPAPGTDPGAEPPGEPGGPGHDPGTGPPPEEPPAEEPPAEEPSPDSSTEEPPAEPPVEDAGPADAWEAGAEAQIPEGTP